MEDICHLANKKNKEPYVKNMEFQKEMLSNLPYLLNRKSICQHFRLIHPLNCPPWGHRLHFPVDGIKLSNLQPTANQQFKIYENLQKL